MIFYLIILLLAFLIYRYILKPWRLYNWYYNHITSLGYKVYKFKWHPIGGRVTQQYKDDLKKYGDSSYFMKHCQGYDVIMSVLGGTPLLFIVNAQLMKQFFAPNKVNIYLKETTFNGPLKKVIGQGIVFSEGDNWKRKRKALTKVFSFDFLVSLIPQMCQQIDNNFKKMEENQQFPKVYITDLMRNIFGGIITKSFFGPKILQERIEGEDIRQFASSLIDSIGTISRSFQVFMFGVKILNLGLRESHRKINHKIKLFKEKSKQFIYSRINEVENSKNTSFKSDIIARIYQFNQQQNIQKEKYTPDEMIDEFSNLFFAGLSTTSQFTTMMIYYLALYPQIKKKVLDEINSIIKGDQDYIYDNLKKLKYLQCVQKETLRCYGPGIFTIIRQAAQDHFLKDIHIFKGTIISNLTQPNSYNQKYYNDPFKFNPDRWLNQSELDNHSHISPNFASGPRNCLGKNLALIQNKICIIKFLQKYNYKLERNQFRLQMKFGYVPERIYTELQKRQKTNQ